MDLFIYLFKEKEGGNWAVQFLLKSNRAYLKDIHKGLFLNCEIFNPGFARGGVLGKEVTCILHIGIIYHYDHDCKQKLPLIGL